MYIIEAPAPPKPSWSVGILKWRGITVPDSVRDRVEACSDLGQLEVWARRAVDATDAEDLFADRTG